MGHVLSGRALALDVDRHAIRVIIVTPMADIGSQLAEIAPLYGLQGVSDLMKRGVIRRMLADLRRHPRRMRIAPFETRAVPLAPEAAEIDACFLTRSAIHEADGIGLQYDAEDRANLLEIRVDGIVPVVVEAAFAKPGAGLFLRDVGKLMELIDGGFDDLRHRRRLRRGPRQASHRYRSMRSSRRRQGRAHAPRRRSHRGVASSRCWRIGTPIGR